MLPSTCLMLGVPASVARCKEIVIATPPRSVRPVGAMAAVQPHTTVPDGILRLCRPTLSPSKRVHACCPGTPGPLAQCIKHGCAIRSLGELNPRRSCGRCSACVCHSAANTDRCAAVGVNGGRLRALHTYAECPIGYRRANADCPAVDLNGNGAPLMSLCAALTGRSARKCSTAR